MSERVVKSVSFSNFDMFEMNLLEHAKQFGSFSKYVKRLIQRDMEGGYSPQINTPPVFQAEEQSGEDAEYAESFL